MTDHLEAARKVLDSNWKFSASFREAIDGGIAALDRAGLLRTGDERELFARLSPRALELLKTPVGMLGQRIGVASDFPCHQGHVTALHERALKACEDFHVAWPHAADGGSYSERVVAGIGRESLALNSPRYLRCDCGERVMAEAGSTGAGTSERHSVTYCKRAVFDCDRYDRIPHDSKLPESLKQPKERWTARQSLSDSALVGRGKWIAEDREKPGRNIAGLTKDEATAICDALNAAERGTT